MKKGKRRKCWYEIFISECVLCGHGDEHRERRYGRKPAAKKRYHFSQYVCLDHFM